MFWNTKVECDGCNAKIAKKGALFHRGEYVHESIPIARALGYPDVAVLERFGFGALMPHVVEALQRARWRATQP